MKLKELYSVIAIIFATNFKGVISEENFKKISPNWVIKNETQNNQIGSELWQKALKSDYNELIEDYENLKSVLDMSYFKLVSQTDLTLLYEKTKYQKPFELSPSHSANMLAFLVATLKQDVDEKTHNMLGLYLSEYFVLSFRALASHLQIHAKSDYYKALGYFLADYLNMIKISLGLKI